MDNIRINSSNKQNGNNTDSMDEEVIEKSFNLALEVNWYDGLIAASQHYVVNLDSLKEEMTGLYRGYPQNFGYFDKRAEEMVESLVKDICLTVGSFLEAEVPEWERQQERAFEEGKQAMQQNGMQFGGRRWPED